MTAELKMEQVDVKYDRTEILRKVNLHLKSPRIYGLLGRDGTGKTTLLKLLASFQKPDRGRVLYNGEPVFENAALMPSVYFVYWEDYHDDYDKGEKKIREAAQHRPNFDKAYAYRLAEMMKINLSQPVKKYSRGRAASLQLLLGLASRAPVTLFDEVFLNLDAPARDIFYDELLNEQERHPRLFVLSSHLIAEMEHLFDEVIILHQQEVIMQEPYRQLVSQGVLVKGPALEVDDFTKEYPTAGEKLRAGIKSVEVYGTISEEFLEQARKRGLEVRSLSLQEVFTQLTREEADYVEK